MCMCVCVCVCEMVVVALVSWSSGVAGSGFLMPSDNFLPVCYFCFLGIVFGKKKKSHIICKKLSYCKSTSMYKDLSL